jgi:hypothetical protein
MVLLFKKHGSVSPASGEAEALFVQLAGKLRRLGPTGGIGELRAKPATFHERDLQTVGHAALVVDD